MTEQLGQLGGAPGPLSFRDTHSPQELLPSAPTWEGDRVSMALGVAVALWLPWPTRTRSVSALCPSLSTTPSSQTGPRKRGAPL